MTERLDRAPWRPIHTRILLSYTVGLLGLLTAFALLAAFFVLGVLAALIWRTRGTEARALTLEQAAPLVTTGSLTTSRHAGLLAWRHGN